MERIIVDNCPVCDPVNKLINDLLHFGFIILEKKLVDYHFHELYFKLKGDLGRLNQMEVENFNREGDSFICKCHWTTIELVNFELV